MVVPARLNVVVLGVRDLDTMRAFYESFGWRPRPRTGMFARLELAGATLMLFPLDTLSDVVGLAPSGDGIFRGTVNAIVAASDAEAEEILAAASAAGGRVLGETKDREWGARTAYFADPETNVWEVAVVPGVTFDERGALIWPGRS